MNYVRSITSAITIADQPDPADLQSLHAQGYTAVLNLRNDGEPEQPLTVAEEGEAVRSLGMDYHHYAIGGKPLDLAGVTDASDFVDAHARKGGKVLVHCRKGGRAAAMVLVQQARAQGWDAPAAIARSRNLGTDVEGGLKLMVEQYLTANPPKSE